MAAIYALFCFLACVVAQTNTPTSTRPSRTVSNVSTLSIFLPSKAPSMIQASIISANLSQTVYALGCNSTNSMSNKAESECGYNPPITLTEGPSTLIYTLTQSNASGTNPLLSPFQSGQPTTISCALLGADRADTTFVGASSATCVGQAAVEGLGILGSTSMLASTEIRYVNVTVTAGLEKLVLAASTTTASTSTATESRAAAMPMATAAMGWSGVLGIVLLSML